MSDEPGGPRRPFPVDLDISESDIFAAMREISGYLDITPADFREVYRLAFRHAVERLTHSVQARDVMTREVVTARADTTLVEVATLMAKQRVSGLPVVDEDGRVAGVISERDFIAHMVDDGDRTFIEVVEACQRADGCTANSILPHTAGEIMTAPATTIPEDLPLPEIAARFAEGRVNRLPVVDGEGRLTGIVSRWDMVQSVLAACPPLHGRGEG